MKRKIVAAMLVLAMTVGMVAGCGEETVDVKQQSENVEKDDTQESIAADGEYYTDDNGNQFYKTADGTEYYVDINGNMYKRFDDVTLNLLWDWNGGAGVVDDQYNSEYATIVRERLGITVIYEEVYTDEAEKLNMVFAGGDMPDIIEAPYWGGVAASTVSIKQAADDGLLLDISDLYQNYNFLDEAFKIGNITEAYWKNDINIWDGSLYVMPARLDGSDEEYTPNNYTLCVRQDVAETLGVDPLTIDTAEELYDFMKAADEYGFKDINGNDTITLGTFHEGNYFMYLYRMFSDKRWTDFLLDEDGNVTYQWLDEDYAINGSTYIWKLVNEGIMDVECFTQSKDLGKQKAGNGSVLFIAGKYDTAIDSTIETGLYDAYPEMRYVPLGGITYKDGDTIKSLESRGSTGSHVYIFPETCANIDAALTWIDYLSSPEGQLLVSKGPNGVNYTWDGSLDGETGFEYSEEYVQRMTEDKNAVEAEMEAKGYDFSNSEIAGHGEEWFGSQTDLVPENEYILYWYELAPVEFAEKTTINTYASDYEGYTEAMNLLGENPIDDVIQQAFFADTEEQAVEIIRKWQDKIKNSEVFTGLLEYLTECYKADPDNICF